MGVQRKKDYWQTAAKNNQMYRMYFNRLKELAISMFEWKNLPNTVDARFLEMTLFDEGCAAFFEDEVMGYLSLQVMLGTPLSVYRIPTRNTAYAVNGYNKPITKDDSVLIFNNNLHTNCAESIGFFAYQLYECSRTIDTNIKAQKTPVMILSDEKQRLTMKNLYAQYSGNEPFIFGSKNLDLSAIKAINTGAPFIADRLMQIKFQIWNEAMTYLGISNVNMHKKERLLNNEVTQNMGSTVASRYPRLDVRKKACKEINKMFGLNIDVDFREDIRVLNTEIDEQSGGWG